MRQFFLETGILRFPLCLFTFILFFRLAHHDNESMFRQTPFQWYQITAYPPPIYLHPGNTVFETIGILDLDRINRLAMPIAETETRPG